MHIAIVGILILCNGLLSMSEFAVVSSNKTRLRQRADSGKPGAKSALDLLSDSSRFLSTVQVGITLVGILVGTLGGASIVDGLAPRLAEVSFLAEHARTAAYFIVVGTTTYLTLVIGELVPKQLAIRHPEKIASFIAGPMKVLAIVTLPLVAFLSKSSALVLRLLGQQAQPEETVSEEEVKLLLRRGQESGVFRRSEAQMVAGVFRLDDIRADAVMTPRVDVEWLDRRATKEEILAVLSRSRHSLYPVCDGGIDHVIGVVRSGAIASTLLAEEELDLSRITENVEMVPESSDAGTLVKQAAETGKHFMVVLNEHGGVDGIVTTHDLAEAVLGDLGVPDARRTETGDWLVSGAMPIEEAEALLETKGLRDDQAKSFGTLAGFIMNALGRLPEEGEHVDHRGLRFTAHRVRKHRVIEVLVTKHPVGSR